MGNIFDNIPESLPAEIFESLIVASGVRVERIISKGHTSPEAGWYDQALSEWVMVLKGKALIDFAEKPAVTLVEGDYIDIKAHEKHRVQWTDPDRETIWLAIHYKN
jgi:cupin 2 domain-containing protein